MLTVHHRECTGLDQNMLKFMKFTINMKIRF